MGSSVKVLKIYNIISRFIEVSMHANIKIIKLLNIIHYFVFTTINFSSISSTKITCVYCTYWSKEYGHLFVKNLKEIFY